MGVNVKIEGGADRPVDEAALAAARVVGRAGRGRGAPSNRTGRYEAQVRVPADDGWHGLAEQAQPTPTEVRTDHARTVIVKNQSPDIPFDRSVNPYQGCEHGCVYCYARPSHARYGLSPGLDFETKLFAKPDAAKRLRMEIARPTYTPAVLSLGANTDPYQPVEKRLEITRSILEVLAAANHPVAIVTKSSLVTRDIDILAPMAAKGLASVALSITTLDGRLARAMEPRAPTPARRLEALHALNAAGIPTGVLMAPLIPGLTDMEIETLLGAAADEGVRRAGYVLLRLPLELKRLWEEWLETHVPDRASRVLSLVRQTRGGQLYQSDWHTRHRGTGPIADLIGDRFDRACQARGLNRGLPALRTDLFVRPTPDARQIGLF